MGVEKGSIQEAGKNFLLGGKIVFGVGKIIVKSETVTNAREALAHQRFEARRERFELSLARRQRARNRVSYARYGKGKAA